MRNETGWRHWRRFFERRSNRPLPRLDVSDDYGAIPKSLARSLAVFQLGESGGGTVVQQARDSRIHAADEDYAAALALFVAEEHRHAELLALCVRMLGGELITKNWTAHLFVVFRRLLGLRLKVLVLLAAEVVGLCYYRLLAVRLPHGQLRRYLLQIAADEGAHLKFHGAFLRTQCTTRLHRLLFGLAWRATMLAAAIVVVIDHRAALRDLHIPTRLVWRTWMQHARAAERVVCGDRPSAAYPPRIGHAAS